MLVIAMLILFGSGFGGGGGGGGETGLLPLTIDVQIAFHDRSFRDLLVEENDTVAVWPLAEIRGVRYRDIVNGHDGELQGSGGIGQAVSVGLPEGGLGAEFSGTQYIQVPDDSGLGANLNLSLANGDIDIVFLIKTSTNDATNRAIVQKMVATNGNGWSASLVNGAIRFRVEVSSQIFSMDRGSIADGAWHLVQCNYQTGPGEARIFIDGVQSGATVTGVTTEPIVTGENLRIGEWNNNSGGFIGSLSYVMIGRQGNAALSASLDACRDWTSVLSDTRSAVPMVIKYGIQGSSPLDNTAGTGTCTVALDNTTSNSGGLLGYYSLNHANCRSGFRNGSPLRVTFTYDGTTYVKHVGRIVSAHPSPGVKRDRLTRVTSADWMDVAASSRPNLPAQTNIRSDNLVGFLVDEALRPPHSVGTSLGSSTFAYALHVGGGQLETILSEISRANTNELGRLFIRGNTQYGGELIFHSRGHQQTYTGIESSFVDTMSGLVPNEDQKPNRLLVTVHPVVVDGGVSVLYSMPTRQEIPPLATVEFQVTYQDPDNTALSVGGIDIVTPATPTDYTMTGNEDGTGADLSAYASIAEAGSELAGTSPTLTVTNESSSVGWFKTQIRGRRISHQYPITKPVGDPAVVRRDGPRDQALDLVLTSSSEFARDVGTHILSLYERQRIQSVSFIANSSHALMLQALQREPGDRIGVAESMQSGGAETTYVINHVEFEVMEGGIIRCTWTLAPAFDEGQVWVLGQAGASELGDTTVLGL